jgi:phage-related protein
MSTILGDKVTCASTMGSIAFNNVASVSTDWPGVIKARIDELSGWDDTVDLNVISVPKGFGDGAYTAPRFPAKSRMLTVSGYLVAPNRATLDLNMDRLALYAFPQDTDIVLTRFQPVPKYVTARLAGPISIAQYQGAEGGLRFEAILLCSDPFRYDALNTLSGTSGVAGLSTGGRTYKRVYPLVYGTTALGSGNQVLLYNVGTAVTYPTFTIHGPLPSGWRLENSTTGAEEAFDIDLSTGDTLVIDNANKQAYLNGSLVNGLLNGEWWSLAPLGNVIKLFGDYNATASFTVTAVSRWR